MRQYYVYILASRRNGTLYIGMTSDLPRRIDQHRSGVANSFTQKYGVHTLVYYELGEDLESARIRERNLKAWRRAWKIRLIQEQNPYWKDLGYTLVV